MERRIVRHSSRLSAALDSGFHVGERVRTLDGHIGRVVMITESFSPGNTQYQILLDNGMGGGTFLASQLRPVPEGYGGGHQHPAYLPAGVTAAYITEDQARQAFREQAELEHEASLDYPEMGDILRDRPDPGRQITVIGHFKQNEDLDSDDPESHNYGWCHVCKEHHGDQATAEEHDSSHTDWRSVYKTLPSRVYRGMALQLPSHVHERVHDPDIPAADRARMLSEHLGHGRLGTSWTPTQHQAEHYADVGAYGYKGGSYSRTDPSITHVVMHAAKPKLRHIETDPDILEERGVLGYDKHEDSEIPLQDRAPVRMHALSWKRDGDDFFTTHRFRGQDHVAATYADGFDPREDDYNGAPEVGGVYWGAPAQQAFVDSELGQPLDPMEEMGLEPPPPPPPEEDEEGLEATAARHLDLYHHTDEHSARRLLAGHPWEADPETDDLDPRVYLSDRPHEEAARYGPVAVHVRVPESLTEVDDEFPSGETHYTVPLDRSSHIRVIDTDPPLGRTATTINGQPIDSHGDAPEHGTEPRAADPEDYDDRSTEQQGDPKWSDPVSVAEKKEFNGAQIGMYPGGVTNGGGQGPGLNIGAFTAALPDDQPDTLHRGIHTELPADLHDYVHDQSVPREQRAHALAEHFRGAGLGMHWSRHADIADRSIWNAAERGDAAYGAYYQHHGFSFGEEEEPDEGPGSDAPRPPLRNTDIIFHARRPGERNQVRNRRLREQYGVGGLGEDEMALRHGSPVHLTGVSWRKHDPWNVGEPYEHHDFARPLRHTAAADNWQPGDERDIDKYRAMKAGQSPAASPREERGDRWHAFKNRYMPDTLHRGIHVQLPGDLEDYVHDESVPREHRAQALSDHFRDRGGLGMHWTPHVDIAHRALGNASDEPGNIEDEDEGYDDDPYGEHPAAGTDVMFHVRRPGQKHVIRNRQTLEEHEVGWAHSRDEDETPLKPGAPLRLEGISWKQHEPDYPLEPYEHHDFGKPIRHTAGRFPVNPQVIHTARVPWTPEQRTQLHSWQAAPTATEGDFVPSGNFTNKHPEYVPGPDPETEFAEAIGPRAFTQMTAGMAEVTPDGGDLGEDEDLAGGDTDQLPPEDAEDVSGHQTHDPAADEVFAQLSEDFPPEALDWVFDVQWDGPLAVPLEQVDFSDQDSWEAAGEPEKVEKFRAKIEKKEKKGKHPKPAILIAKPSSDLLFVADGHHRALAEQQLEAEGEGDREEPGLWAWVATVPQDEGPWDELHTEQLPEGMGSETAAEPGGPEDITAGGLPGEDPALMEPGGPEVPAVITGLPPMSQGGTPSSERRAKELALMNGGAPPGEEDEGAAPFGDEEAQEGAPPGDQEEEGDEEEDEFPPKKALRMFVRAAGDPAFRFEFTAAWRDVVAKATRINSENGVRITAAYGTIVIGEVKGDHATYESGLQYYPGRPYSIMAYSCGCPWATFHQDADYPGKYNGRLCSHAYALSLASRESGMVRKMLFPEEGIAGWPEQVTVKSEPPWHPSDKSWAREWRAPMTKRPILSSLSSLISDSVDPQVCRVPAVTAARVLLHAGEDPGAVTILMSCAGLPVQAAVRPPLTWDQIGERHPGLYGDPEVHGEAAEGADGEGIGWAANHLANDRPSDPDGENTGVWDMHFHEESVYPHHIDYARTENDDPRVRRAYQGYLNHPERVPPLVLVHRHGVYLPADGHHRAQGAEMANKKVRAYVAYSEHDDEPFSSHDGEPPARAPFYGAKPSPGVAAHRNYFRKQADQANAPWGAQNVSEVPPAKPYGATSPPEKDRDPGSYGPLSGPDPDNWGEIQDNSAIQMPLTNDAALHHEQVQPENEESFGYADRANTAGPSTSITPRDPAGIRMEEARASAWAAFTASLRRTAHEVESGDPSDEEHPAQLVDISGATGDAQDVPHAYTEKGDHTCSQCGLSPSAVVHGRFKGQHDLAERKTALIAEPQLDGALAELKDEPEGALDPEGLTGARDTEDEDEDEEYDPFDLDSLLEAMNTSRQTYRHSEPVAPYPVHPGRQRKVFAEILQNPWDNRRFGTYEDAKAYNLARTLPDYTDTSSTTDSGRAQHPAQETQNPGLGSWDDPYSPGDPSIQTVGTNLPRHGQPRRPGQNPAQPGLPTNIDTTRVGNQQWSGAEIDSGDLSFRPDVQEHLPEQAADQDVVAQFHMTGAAAQYRTDGAVQVGDSDIAAAAQAYLRKQADCLPPEEADELIREGRGQRARNLDLLDLRGTHYVDDDRLDDHEDDVLYA